MNGDNTNETHKKHMHTLRKSTHNAVSGDIKISYKNTNATLALQLILTTKFFSPAAIAETGKLLEYCFFPKYIQLYSPITVDRKK